MSYFPNATPEQYSGGPQALQLIAKNLLMKIRCAAPCIVQSVSNDGDLSPVGTVTVLPLVQQIDVAGTTYDHAPLYNVPYLRIQGGANAVILDPKVGDIGIVVFCDRDISAVKASKQASPPGSARSHDMSDAVYLNTVIGTTTPTQYVQFTDDGITVHSPTQVTVSGGASVTLSAPQIVIDGALTQGAGGNGGTATLHNGLTTPADVVAGTVSLKSHTHSGVQTGSGNTGAPVA